MRLPVLALFAALAAPSPVRAAAADEAGPPPSAAPGIPSSEPVWRTMLLAPGRVLGHGRFDAARPSYHASLAAEEEAREAARAADRCAAPLR